MNREKKISIAINAMFIIVLIALCTLATIIKCFGGWVERFYISVIEFYAFWKLTCKIVWWICGKLDEWEK